VKDKVVSRVTVRMVSQCVIIVGVVEPTLDVLSHYTMVSICGEKVCVASNLLQDLRECGCVNLDELLASVSLIHDRTAD
jgi:hypothetical protein